MAQPGGEPVVVGDVEIEKPLARQPDRVVDVGLLDVEVERVQADPAIGLTASASASACAARLKK